jgi:nucleoside-diphosphate-sugar epimerase
VRDFIYVEDVVDAYLNTCNIKVLPGEIFNIGTGIQSAVEDVVGKIMDLTKTKSVVEWGAIPTQERQIEMGKWQADTKKSEKVLKWKAKYGLDEGLDKTIGWFRKNLNLYE